MERQEPTIEELLNKIALLKEALKFYGNEQNYSNGSITLDNGHQAKFALQQITAVDKYNQDMIDEAMKSIEQIDQQDLNPNDFGSEFQDKLQEINQIIKKHKKQ